MAQDNQPPTPQAQPATLWDLFKRSEKVVVFKVRGTDKKREYCGTISRQQFEADPDLIGKRWYSGEYLVQKVEATGFGEGIEIAYSPEAFPKPEKPDPAPVSQPSAQSSTLETATAILGHPAVGRLMERLAPAPGNAMQDFIALAGAMKSLNGNGAAGAVDAEKLHTFFMDGVKLGQSMGGSVPWDIVATKAESALTKALEVFGGRKQLPPAGTGNGATTQVDGGEQVEQLSPMVKGFIEGILALAQEGISVDEAAPRILDMVPPIAWGKFKEAVAAPSLVADIEAGFEGATKYRDWLTQIHAKLKSLVSEVKTPPSGNCI